ncbi:hypothetical protein [Streptomyces tauricus]|uniref:hypothetical protein n=1 Tax=Streptomyces tauricus TaxID=68274 RepID=UPI0033B8C180
MTIQLITVVNLIIAVSTIGLGLVKAWAGRDAREWTLGLTASVLICAGLIFLFATPVIYRLVGDLLRSPNICALLVPVTTLVCVAHAHVMIQLWQPEKRGPAVLRRTGWRWGPVYAGAIALMTGLYFHADLGPATPLHFASAYADVPEVIALHLVYWAALSITVVTTVRECRALSIPGRPDLVENLKKALAWFVLALAFDLVNVAITAATIIGSTGLRRLDGLNEAAWLATIASSISANIALASHMLRSRRVERQDMATLQPLHDLVIDDEDDPSVVLAPRWTWAGFLNHRDLDDMIAEIGDGMGQLSPWWSPIPSAALNKLVPSCSSKDLGDDWDLTAAQVAATMLHATRSHRVSLREFPPPLRLARLPGTNIEPTAERHHFVRVAQHLTHPLVVDAAAIADRAQATSAP